MHINLNTDTELDIRIKGKKENVLDFIDIISKSFYVNCEYDNGINMFYEIKTVINSIEIEDINNISYAHILCNSAYTINQMISDESRYGILENIYYDNGNYNEEIYIDKLSKKYELSIEVFSKFYNYYNHIFIINGNIIQNDSLNGNYQIIDNNDNNIFELKNYPYEIIIKDIKYCFNFNMLPFSQIGISYP